jgi:hypothetical protein
MQSEQISRKLLFDSFFFFSSVLLTILLAILKSLVWISNGRRMDSFIDYMFTDYWDIMTAHVSKHVNIYAM